VGRHSLPACPGKGPSYVVDGGEEGVAAVVVVIEAGSQALARVDKGGGHKAEQSHEALGEACRVATASRRWVVVSVCVGCEERGCK